MLGLPPEMAARLAASARPAEPQVVEIMPENWGAFRLFLACETQWRRAGMTGVPYALDYAVLPTAAAAIGVTLDADIWPRLKVLEGAAITALLGAG